MGGLLLIILGLGIGYFIFGGEPEQDPSQEVNQIIEGEPKVKDDKNDDQIPNDLLKTLMLLSREKSIQFFGSTKESKFINNSIGRLNHHLILLFGKRKYDPIVFDKSKQRWVSLIKLVDRSNTDRNDMKQSIKIFNKILNTYTGSHRLI